MAYLSPHFDYDIFISYAHANNAKGWVSRLHNDLLIELNGILEGVTIWRDDQELRGNTLFNEKIKNSVNRWRFPPAGILSLFTAATNYDGFIKKLPKTLAGGALTAKGVCSTCLFTTFRTPNGPMNIPASPSINFSTLWDWSVIRVKRALRLR
jgi:hypothetical protein